MAGGGDARGGRRWCWWSRRCACSDSAGRWASAPPRARGLWQRLRPLQRRLLPADTAGKRIALGMLWGWMPCGLSTTLLAAAWLQADARNGALTMAAFGLGTLPLMVPLTWSGARLGQRLQRGGWRIAAGAAGAGAGLLTIAAPWLMQQCRRCTACWPRSAAAACRFDPGKGVP